MYMRNEAALPFRASGDSKQQVRLSANKRIFYAFGKAVDVVNKIGVALEIPLHNPNAPPSAGSVRKWISQGKELVSPGGEIYNMPFGRFEAFWRMMICNLTADGDRPPSEFAYYLLDYQGLCFQYQTIVPKESQPLFFF